MSMGVALLAAVTGFLLGSIPFGVLVLRVTGGPDPRTVGSGNVGATNASRVLGLRGFLLVFFCDLPLINLSYMRVDSLLTPNFRQHSARTAPYGF